MVGVGDVFAIDSHTAYGWYILMLSYNNVYQTCSTYNCFVKFESRSIYRSNSRIAKIVNFYELLLT